jgi:hypothetical protein
MRPPNSDAAKQKEATGMIDDDTPKHALSGRYWKPRLYALLAASDLAKVPI